MSGTEGIALAGSIIVVMMTWVSWLFSLGSVRCFAPARPARTPMVLAAALSMLFLLFVLRTVASHDVVDSVLYTVFYLIMGAAWLGAVTTALAPLMGLSARDDVLERANSAASWAIAGAVLGIMFCFAGSNIGDGPGWWVVVFCAALATLTLFAVWGTLEASLHYADAITIDRDRATAIRLGGFLAAGGLVLGRSVAGDWISAGATIADFFATAWPVFALAALEWIFTTFTGARPTPQRPAVPVMAAGVLPAAVYLLLAVVYVAYLRPWEETSPAADMPVEVEAAWRDSQQLEVEMLS